MSKLQSLDKAKKDRGAAAIGDVARQLLRDIDEHSGKSKAMCLLGVLYDMAMDADVSPSDRIKAVDTLFNRAYGRSAVVGEVKHEHSIQQVQLMLPMNGRELRDDILDDDVVDALSEGLIDVVD